MAINLFSINAVSLYAILTFKQYVLMIHILALCVNFLMLNSNCTK